MARVDRSAYEPVHVALVRASEAGYQQGVAGGGCGGRVELIVGALRDDPRRVGKPLHAPMDGVWSARRAMYRVLNRIDDADHTVTIETIRHRRSAYR